MTSTLDTLRNVTTGTITTMLLKKGIRRSWMAGAMPFGFSGKRVVGPAFTLRFVPVREDLATPESWSKPISTRSAIEAMPENCVVVADAMGVTGAGIFGDILCMRMVKRGVSALITDGVMRDKHGVIATGLPVWCAGVAAPASVNQLTFVGWNEPIGCGGCAIFPGDIIVADDDGAVVIPAALADFVASEGAEHELMESWLVQEVEKGAKLPGLYPPNDENKKRYEEWKKKLSADLEKWEPVFGQDHSQIKCQPLVWAVHKTVIIFFGYGRFAARVRVSVLVRRRGHAMPTRGCPWLCMFIPLIPMRRTNRRRTGLARSIPIGASTSSPSSPQAWRCWSWRLSPS